MTQNGSASHFLSLLSHPSEKKDISGALKQFYGSLPFAPDTEAIPIILYKTHITTIVDGVNKSISIADFTHMLETLIGESEQSVSPMSLPYGCFMFNRSGENLYLNCYYRETIGEIKFDHCDSKQMKIKIPIPNIILSFSLKKTSNDLWQLMQAKYFATSKTVSQLPENRFISNTKPSEGIHRMPFPNMYTDNKMCYGSNTMPVRFNDNLRGLDYYYQILTQAPFNSDLGINGLTSSCSPKTWFELLSTKTEFPYDLLSKIDNY